MYLEERDYMLAGRPVEVFVEDTEGSPAVALLRARRLVEDVGVDILVGGLLASEGYAIAEYARDNDVVTLLSIVSGDDLTQRLQDDYVIRTGWTSSQPMMPFAEWVYNELGYRRVAMITYDFSFGHETMGGFHYTFEEMGGEVAVKLWPPIGTMDYGPFLAQIPEDVDAVVANFSGSDALRFLKQYKEFGYKDKFPLIGAGTLTDEHVLIAMEDEALDIITALHYSAALDTPENSDFVERYRRKGGRIPSYYTEGGYASMAVLELALEKGASIDDIQSILAAIRGVEIHTPRGTFTIDEFNNPVQDIYIRKVERVDGELQNTVIHTIEDVSQFFRYDVEKFLSQPVFSRDFPPIR